VELLHLTHRIASKRLLPIREIGQPLHPASPGLRLRLEMRLFCRHRHRAAV